MTPAPERTTPPAEAGFALVEVLVSAVVITIVAGAVFALMQASARSAAEERHRSEAYAVTQEDQARLRSMRVANLNRLNQTRTVTVNGTPFTVVSTGTFVNDVSGTTSCGQGTSSADYVKVSSTVTWPSIGSRPAAAIQSIITPPNGSLDPSHGTLTISVMNAASAPIAGIGLSGTGAGTFSGTTDTSGCSMFPDQPSGNYTVTPSGVASGLIDKDGNPPSPQTVSVMAGSTTAYTLLFDKAGSVPVEFKYREGSTSNFKASSADSIVAFNTGMTTAKAFSPPGGSPGGPRFSSITATPLFPFTSPDTFYAGACSGNNPNPESEVNPPGAAAMASVAVPANGTAPPQTIQLPALNLIVWTGKNASNKGSPFNGADVWIRDDFCSSGGNPVTRRYTTGSSGQLADPGLPWSRYGVCADTNTGSGSSRRERINNVYVENLTSGTTLNFYLGEGSNNESEFGACP
jgi:Tfp pilus assembly protein PilV